MVLPTRDELQRSYNFVCTANEWRRQPVFDPRAYFDDDVGDSTFEFYHFWCSADAHRHTCLTMADGDAEFVVALEVLGAETRRRLAPFCRCGHDALRRQPASSPLSSALTTLALFVHGGACSNERACLARGDQCSAAAIRQARIELRAM